MNLGFSSLVVLLGLSMAAAAGTTTGSPVERIVKLLEELKGKTVADQKAEQQMYDKYACWCQTTSARKAKDIVEAQALLRVLGQRILKLKGTVAVRTAEIKKLTEDIKSNEDDQATDEAVRQRQNAEWSAESAETKQALGALQGAIGVLAKATTPQKKTELIQTSQLMMMKQAVQSVLDTLPSTIGLPPARMVLLTDFMSAKTSFAPQSATIQGMLGDMYLTFSTNLESATSDEAEQNKNFETKYADLELANNNKREERTRKDTEKTDAEAMLADTTKNYLQTDKQMKANTEFFDSTKKACTSKHKEWTKREEARNQELAGITAALDLLTSDTARALFATSIKPGTETSFLQIASTPSLLQDSANAPAARAYNALKAQVRKSHSIRLAALAVSIRTSKAGHFGAVIEAIDKMLKTLQDEGQDDINKKNQCTKEYQNVAKTVQDLDWKIKNNEAKIANFENLIKLRTQEKEDAIKKKDETEKYIEDITQERHDEHADYQKAKKADQDAKALLIQTKETFTKYMTEHKIDMGAIQGEEKEALLQDPEFARDQDDAPDATFSKKSNNKLKSKGIVSLFEYIIQDLANELVNEKEAEANSQKEFMAEKKTAEDLVDDLEQKIVTLTTTISKRNEDQAAQSKNMRDNNADRTDELDYKKKITPDCDWILKEFTGRANARAAEMNGLQDAKEFLAGKTALIEKSRKFDDAALGKIGFLGVAN